MKTKLLSLTLFTLLSNTAAYACNNPIELSCASPFLNVPNAYKFSIGICPAVTDSRGKITISEFHRYKGGNELLNTDGKALAVSSVIETDAAITLNSSYNNAGFSLSLDAKDIYAFGKDDGENKSGPVKTQYLGTSLTNNYDNLVYVVQVSCTLK